MTPIIILEDEYLDYRYDLDRIVKVFTNRGLYCTHAQAYQLWSKYSESMAAGWMILPDDDIDVFSNISHYFRTDDEREVSE